MAAARSAIVTPVSRSDVGCTCRSSLMRSASICRCSNTMRRIVRAVHSHSVTLPTYFRSLIVTYQIPPRPSARFSTGTVIVTLWHPGCSSGCVRRLSHVAHARACALPWSSSARTLSRYDCPTATTMHQGAGAKRGWSSAHATRSSESQLSKSSSGSADTGASGELSATGTGLSGSGCLRGRPISREVRRALKAPIEVDVQNARLGHEFESGFPSLLQRVGVRCGGRRQGRLHAGAERGHGKCRLPEDVAHVDVNGRGQVGTGRSAARVRCKGRGRERRRGHHDGVRGGRAGGLEHVARGKQRNRATRL